ncbi:SHOCT domain-containing protein [Promicromonospora soli]
MMMWDWDGGFGWGFGLLMMVFMIVFWGGVIWGLIALLRGPVRRWSRDGDHGDAEQVLAGRYARGEIDESEYRERLAVLRSAQRDR